MRQQLASVKLFEHLKFRILDLILIASMYNFNLIFFKTVFY